MRRRLQELSKGITIAALVFLVTCNKSEVPTDSGVAPMSPDVIKVHLAIQGVDPEFVNQLDAAVGFDSIDRVVKRLLQILRTDRDPKRKAQASLCLGALYPNSVDPLIEAVRSENGDVAMYAAGAFAKMGSNGNKAIPELIGALARKEWNVRLFAARALGEMGPDARSKAALEKIVNDSSENPLVKKEASDALRKIGGPS